MIRVIGGVLVALATLSPVHAETAYVTDMLQLEMHETQAMTGPTLQKLRSGDKLEVLERNGRLTRVRASSGRAGWVKGLYLVSEEPARTRVNQLESATTRLEGTVESLREQLAQAQQQVKELEATKAGAAEARAATEDELAGLRRENERLENTLATYASSVPATWAGAALLVALLCGLAGGWYIIDRRSRSRHGGYRVY